MNHVIADQIEFFKELNREERAQAQTREAKRLAAQQQQETERREWYRQGVRGAILHFLSISK